MLLKFSISLLIFLYQLQREVCRNLLLWLFLFFLCNSVIFCIIYFEAMLLGTLNLIFFHNIVILFIVVMLFALKPVLSSNINAPAFFWLMSAGISFSVQWVTLNYFVPSSFRYIACKHHVTGCQALFCLCLGIEAKAQY